MKSFLRFIVILLLPQLIISTFSILYSGNLDDFKNKKALIFSVFFFGVISFAYVYLYSIILKKINNPKIKLINSCGIVFLLVFVFGLFFPTFQFEYRTFLISFFQGTLGICVFLLEYLVLNFYFTYDKKKKLLFSDRLSFYLKVVVGISFFESILYYLMTLDIYIQDPTLATFLNFFLPMLIIPLLINLSAFFSLKLLSKVQFLKYKSVSIIVISVFLALVIVNLFNLVRFNYVFRANGFYLILCTFSIFLLYTIVDYRDKLYRSNKNVIFLKNDIFRKNAEYLQLKQQVNPHFLFNNLNTLISFIDSNPKKAIEFGHHLSNTYRHYLKYQEEDFVLLIDELHFIKEYLEIYKAKFDNGFFFNIDFPSTLNQFILSLSLQELVDNIFKHNSIDETNPITISIYIENDFFVYFEFYFDKINFIFT